MKKETHLIIYGFGILEQGGGFENYIVDAAHELSIRYPQQLKITIVTMTPDVTEKLQHLYSFYYFNRQDPKAIYRENHEDLLKKIGNASYLRVGSLAELKKVFATADIIYAKNEVLELGIISALRIKKRIPVVIGVHTALKYPSAVSISARVHNFLYTGYIYKKLIKNSSLIIVNNVNDRDFVIQKLKFANTKVIHPPFTVSRLSQKRNNSSVFRILYVGRLSQQKGIELLIETINGLLLESEVKVEIKIAGSGDDHLEKKIQELSSLNQSVEYLGHIPNSEIRILFDWTDIVLITSHYETLNKVAIEAAIAGKVVLSTDISGPREAIEDGRTGFLLAPEASVFIQKIKNLSQLKLDDPAAFYSIGEQAHTKALSEFDGNSIYPILYKEVVKCIEK